MAQGNDVSPVVSHDDCVRAVNTAFSLPPESAPTMADIARRIGTGILPLLIWLANHPALIIEITGDIRNGNYAKAIQDVIDAWNADHPPVPAGTRG